MAPDMVTARYSMRYTSTPNESAASGSSPTDRRRSPTGVRHSTNHVRGKSATPSTISSETFVVAATNRSAKSEMKNRPCEPRSRRGPLRNGSR